MLSHKWKISGRVSTWASVESWIRVSGRKWIHGRVGHVRSKQRVLRDVMIEREVVEMKWVVEEMGVFGGGGGGGGADC